MEEKNSMLPKSTRTLTDEQIVTERKVARRSFLSASGALLMGAATLGSVIRATAAGDDPKPSDRDKRADSDKHPGDRDRDRHVPDHKPSDRDRRRDDPDKKPHDPV
jgi:hypothetical protein